MWLTSIYISNMTGYKRGYVMNRLRFLLLDNIPDNKFSKRITAGNAQFTSDPVSVIFNRTNRNIQLLSHLFSALSFGNHLDDPVFCFTQTVIQCLLCGSGISQGYSNGFFRRSYVVKFSEAA